MAAALQQSPLTFQYRSPPSMRRTTSINPRLSFSGIPKLQKLSVKLTRRSRGDRGGGGGAAGAKMAESAAGSYASALAEVASSNGTLETTAADVENIEKIFTDPEVFDFFTSPIISLEKKRSVLDEITGAAKLQPHIVNFLNILIDMKRIDMIKEIVKEFEIVYNKLTDTELAVVSSVVKLDSQHLAQIAKGVQKLTGAKNVRIKTAIDESLVAGFTIRYGNAGSKLIDMSVKKQLEEIAAQLEVGEIPLAV